MFSNSLPIFSWKTARLLPKIILSPRKRDSLSSSLLHLLAFFPFRSRKLILYYEIPSISSHPHPSSCVICSPQLYVTSQHYFQIQTPGGASFQEGTVCTIATYNPDDAEVGGGAIGYSSRKETTTGDYVNATGTPKGKVPLAH